MEGDEVEYGHELFITEDFIRKQVLNCSVSLKDPPSLKRELPPIDSPCDIATKSHSMSSVKSDYSLRSKSHKLVDEICAEGLALNKTPRVTVGTNSSIILK